MAGLPNQLKDLLAYSQKGIGFFNEKGEKMKIKLPLKMIMEIYPSLLQTVG